MSLLKRRSSSSCIGGVPGWKGGLRAPKDTRPAKASRPGGDSLGRLRALLRIHLPELHGGLREPCRQVVEAQVPGAVLVLEGDPDLGPPGLLLVSDGSLDCADDLHHFLVVHDFFPFALRAAFLRPARFAPCGSTGAPREARPAFTEGRPRARGNRESRRASPRRANHVSRRDPGGARAKRAGCENARTGPQKTETMPTTGCGSACMSARAPGGAGAKTQAHVGGGLRSSRQPAGSGGREGPAVRAFSVLGEPIRQCPAHAAEARSGPGRPTRSRACAPSRA